MQRAFHKNGAERLLEVEAAKVKMDSNEEWGCESNTSAVKIKENHRKHSVNSNIRNSCIHTFFCKDL